MIWLGEKRGYLTDWVTQQWVRATGRKFDVAETPWLDGLAGGTRRIGTEFFDEYARERGLEPSKAEPRGLVEDFSELQCQAPVSQPVRAFYERTSEYELDAWAEWRGFFRPFGRALAILFSRRLQQLNVPLSPLDSSRGMTSEVRRWRDSAGGKAVLTAWVRRLRATRNVLYAGCYSVCRIPGFEKPCVKVVFPLPNGCAMVLMRPEAHVDGSFSLTSSGDSFGHPGFYFVVRGQRGEAWARYVKSMRETIHVYSYGQSAARADHVLSIWGFEFLRLHYRMRLADGGTTS